MGITVPSFNPRIRIIGVDSVVPPREGEVPPSGLVPLAWDDSEVTVSRKPALDWDDEEGLTHRSLRAPLACTPCPEGGAHESSWDDDEDITMRGSAEDIRATVPSMRAVEAHHLYHACPNTIVDETSATVPPTVLPTELDVQPPATRLCELRETQRDLPRLVDTAMDLEVVEVDFTPAPRAHRPSRDCTSVAPVAISTPPPPRAGSWRGLLLGAAAAVVVAAGFVAHRGWLRDGALRIELASKAGDPPSKAEIFVDGHKACDTHPCIVDKVSPGAHVIKVVAAGLQGAGNAETHVVAGEQRTVVVDMPPPMSQRLSVRSSQRGIKLLVDGVARGELPRELTDLTPGRHTLTFEGERHLPLTREVRIEPGRAVDLGSIELAPIPEAPAAKTADPVVVAPIPAPRAVTPAAPEPSAAPAPAVDVYDAL
jgi:hypothetical protein